MLFRVLWLSNCSCRQRPNTTSKSLNQPKNKYIFISFILSSTITAFSSGSGYGSLIALVLYVFLRDIGLEVSKILPINLLFIAVESCAFFVILRPPCRKLARPAHHNLSDHEPLVTIRQKWNFIPQVLPFMLPYTIQNFALYMILRGAV